MIMNNKVSLTELYLRIEANARDMAAILGWGFDPKILGAILSVRADIASFTSLMAATEHDLAGKRKVVEHYFDIEGAMGAWVDGLAKTLGTKVTP